MRTLGKLMIATFMALAASGPGLAWERQADKEPVQPDTAETMVVKASQPTTFCYAERKCTEGPMIMVNDLERFDSAMKQALGW
jgi:hypothetical protein